MFFTQILSNMSYFTFEDYVMNRYLLQSEGKLSGDSTELNLLNFVWDDSFHWRDKATYLLAIYKPHFKSRMSNVYFPCLSTNINQDNLLHRKECRKKLHHLISWITSLKSAYSLSQDLTICDLLQFAYSCQKTELWS